jgi:hypothetical protein
MSSPLPTDPVAVELHIRSLIVAKLQAVDATWKAQDKPRYIVGEKEWLAAAAFRVGNAFETRGAFLKLAGFSEVDEGKCDQTILRLNYELHLFTSIIDRRADGSNSHDDLVSYELRVRASFKADRTFGYSRSFVEHKLWQTTEALHSANVDGADLYQTKLELVVEIDQ